MGEEIGDMTKTTLALGPVRLGFEWQVVMSGRRKYGPVWSRPELSPFPAGERDVVCVPRKFRLDTTPGRLHGYVGMILIAHKTDGLAQSVGHAWGTRGSILRNLQFP